ncbi:unnamed protein product [Schistosoma curassoni]|uniref:Uncharacterized protein n=1 Tax=Schistosoma curassoni TaxID=6186 RepID=A0A183JL06_9TREM|nr:unnamed protein product [Schistosoma curassoni]
MECWLPIQISNMAWKATFCKKTILYRRCHCYCRQCSRSCCRQ